MILPKWYHECVEDYLSILRSSQDYTKIELFEATKKQRLAEYKLMIQRMTSPPAAEKSYMAPVSDLSSVPPLAKLRQYDNSIMYKGNFQVNRPKQNRNTRGLWENILK